MDPDTPPDALRETAATEEKKPLWPKIRIGLVLLIVAAVLIVILQNAAAVPLKFLFWGPTEVSLVGLLIITFLFGALAGCLLAYLRPWRRKHKS